MITVTVLVPAYNEEATILRTLERVNAQRVDGCVFELLVVDDGSQDRTAELLRSRPDLYARLLRNPRNLGKGGAVIAGLRHASGEYVLMQDADLEYDPDDYARLLLPVVRFGADIVMGSRLTAPPYTRVHYFWHRVGNHLITTLFNIFNNTTFTDIYSGYLVFRRSLVDPDELRAHGWDQQAEILSRAVARAKVIYEVPISYHGRSYDEGKKIRAGAAVWVVWRILKEALLRPGRAYTPSSAEVNPRMPTNDESATWPRSEPSASALDPVGREAETQVVVPLEPPFADERGEIQPLVEAEMRSALVITSKKGTLRGNHYHKTDWHYCYVLSGSMEYLHRPYGNREPPQSVVVKAGQMFFTPPMVEHAMRFLEDTTFLTLGRNPRDQVSYEGDVVRVELARP